MVIRPSWIIPTCSIDTNHPKSDYAPSKFQVQFPRVATVASSGLQIKMRSELVAIQMAISVQPSIELHHTDILLSENVPVAS